MGGFFSAKRCAAAIPLNAWVDPRDVVPLCEAILVVYRNNGSRENRQKSRLMWLIDDWGLEKFRSAVEQHLGHSLQTAAPKDEIMWDKRDHIGIHAQQQLGLNFVGLHVPVGRLYANEMFELARMADVYGGGEIRLTVEQNVIIPNIPDSRLGAFLREPLLQVFSIDPNPLARALVSCTGNQFCKFALVETKNRAVALMNELDRELQMPKPVRMHWTGCPNSCGQPQVAEIGFMGTKVRKDGKMVEGVDIYMGGKVGKDAALGECVQKRVACEDLKPLLRDLLIEKFGAQPRAIPLQDSDTAGLDRDRAIQGLAITNGKSTAVAVELEPIPSTAVPAVPTVEPETPAQPAVVVFGRSGHEVTGGQSQSILEIAEAAGVEIESSCQSGTCGTCKHKLLEGDIVYDGDPEGLEADERDAGMILTCIAHPAGRVVVDA